MIHTIKLNKGDFLYKEMKVKDKVSLALVYRIDDISNTIEGTIVWSTGNTTHWGKGMQILNINTLPDTMFTTVKKLSNSEYIAKII